jgi:hypothetical protein
MCHGDVNVNAHCASRYFSGIRILEAEVAKTFGDIERTSSSGSRKSWRFPLHKILAVSVAVPKILAIPPLVGEFAYRAAWMAAMSSEELSRQWTSRLVLRVKSLT